MGIIDITKRIKEYPNANKEYLKLYYDCKNEFNFNDENTVLVLKDILNRRFKSEKNKTK